MNHLFLMQVHREPEILDELLTNLENENHYFMINVDSKSNTSVFENILEHHKNIIQITRQNIAHGGFSQVRCTLEQIQYSFECGIRFDYFHTISGQDYPCVSKQVFDLFFERNEGKSYMMVDPPKMIEAGRNQKYRQRLECWNFADVINSRIARRLKVSSILKKALSPVKHGPVNIEQIVGGWNWFSLHSTAVEYLMDYVKKKPEFVKGFKFSYCGDELFFTSILYSERERLSIVIDNSLRYVEWHAKRYCASRPLILDEREFYDILKSGAFFCRKVTKKDSQKLIDLLNSTIENMELKIPKMNPKKP